MLEPHPSPPRFTVVSVPACHLCDDARALLASFPAGEAVVAHVAADSDEGRALVARHRPALAPLVLLDGEFLSSGRLSRGRLRRALRTRAQALGVVNGAGAVTAGAAGAEGAETAGSARHGVSRVGS
ncbi:glutaredoxin [Oerskovia turbata]